MTEGREDGNWDTALLSHQEMQSEIITGRNIELYDDVERLLPEGINPTCIEQVLSVDPYVAEDKAHNNRKRKSAADGKTSKAKKARGEPVPEGALDGFIMASSLTKKGKKLGSAKKGRLGVRTDLLPGADSESDSDDMTTLSQLGRSRVDDSEEDSPPPIKKPKPRSSDSSKTKSARTSKRSLNAETESPLQAKFTKASALRTAKGGSSAGTSARKLVPAKKKKSVVVEESDTEEDEDEDPLNLSSASKERTVTSGGPRIPVRKVTPRNVKAAKEILPSSDFSNIDSRWMLDVDDDEFDSQISSKGNSFKTPSAIKNMSSRSMPPPSFIPARALVKTPSTVDPSPIPARKTIKKKIILATSSDGEERRSTRIPSSDKEQLDFTSPTVPLGARQIKPRPRRLNHLIEDDVAVEGDTTMGDDLSGEESDSDRRFAGHFEPTQAPNGFNQRAAYLAGLSTQGRPGGPDFSDHSDRHGRFLAKARRPVFLSQEDDGMREGPSSEYEGSFVCGDDTVEYESDEEI
jgi:ATP-dependent DNA helicase MPH1